MIGTLVGLVVLLKMFLSKTCNKYCPMNFNTDFHTSR